MEILSDSSRLIDEKVKFELYREYGLKNYLILDPENQTIHAYQLKDEKYLKRSPDDPFPLKGCHLELDFSDIFE
ncbi:MAG: Uma2 family endonuclease [Saprospiraceae bacterium]|nr:Uma2 family endonuclease [Saprospiraceae bacterium]